MPLPSEGFLERFLFPISCSASAFQFCLDSKILQSIWLYCSYMKIPFKTKINLGLIIFAVVLLSLSVQPVFADEPVLGPAPLMPQQPESLVVPDSALSDQIVFDQPYRVYLPLTTRVTNDFGVKTDNRQSVLDLYNQHYANGNHPTLNWSGSINTCSSGSTSEPFKESVLERINFFRAMAGVPPTITFNESYNQKAQAAALVMSANNSLDHTPPSSWACYSAMAYDGASHANLALGGYGRDAIRMYMSDFGSGNGAVGHRRWILYPQTQEMGTGDVPNSSGHWSSNALIVFDSHMWEPRPETRHAFVAWPPPGYVPYPIVYPRWSFSYAKADFSSASVSMTKNGTAVNQIALEKVQNGYGENTLVWIPMGLSSSSAWPVPSGDEVYQVTVRNVKINGVYRDFNYQVTIFSP